MTVADESPSAERALAELRRELRGAVGALEDLSDDGVGSQARRLLAAREAREALVRAQRTIDSQDETIRELAQTVTTLARQLLESHARFSEWMLTHREPSSRPEGPR